MSCSRLNRWSETLVAMRRIRGLFLLSVIVVVAGLGGSPARAQSPSIEWRNCAGSFQCGTLTVPLDYDNPNGPTTEIAVIRRPAREPKERIGALFANPGGPGASGIDFVRGWALVLDNDLLDRFDIVGWDPRGIGQSDPLECHDNLQEYVAVDPTPDSEAEFEALRDITREWAEDCAEAAGEALDHYGTKNVARDMDQIRQALGDRQLSYLGYSYGTVIGQVYAELFPGNIRAMVLDGAVDLSLSADELARTQVQGFERALNNFLEDCRDQGDECRLNERGDPGDVLKELLERVEESPIPSKDADRPAGPGETVLGVIAPLYSVAWERLDRIIDQALDGDGSGLVDSADSYLDRRGNDYANSTEMNIAVNCIDNAPGDPPLTYAEYKKELSGLSDPTSILSDALSAGFGCEYWEATPDPLEPPVDVRGTPPIVILSTTGDPATPYQWGVAVSEQLAGSVLVSYLGEGHTVYAQGEECIDDLVDDYFLELRVPEPGVECGDGPPIPDLQATPAGPSTPPAPGSTATPRPTRTPRPTTTAGPSRGDVPSGDGSTAWTIVGASALVLFGVMAAVIVMRSRR